MCKILSKKMGLFLLLLCIASLSQAQERFLQIDNKQVNIYYEDEGSGPAIVFIPGWTMTTGFFARQQTYFKDQYRVISYDPRSQGRSSKTMQKNTYAQHAIDLKEMLAALDLSEVILVGWSSGCLTMYAYLEQFGTDCIKKMVFIDEPPKWIGDRSNEWVYGTFEGYRSSLKGLLNNRLDGAYSVVEWMLNEQVSEKEKNWMVSEMLLTPDHAALSLYIDGLIADYNSVLKENNGKTPMLFLLRNSWLEDGKVWLNEHVSKAEVLPISSHAMFWERAEEFNQILERFIMDKD